LQNLFVVVEILDIVLAEERERKPRGLAALQEKRENANSSAAALAKIKPTVVERAFRPGKDDISIS
jgi:hypothetical protein